MSSTTATFGLSADNGLARYFAETRRFAMLTADRELALAKRWRESGDPSAADELVTSHLRLVAKIAMKYRGYGLPITEMISEGHIGLMQAVKRFEPERGFRLATYAMWWIRAAIQEYILRSWSLVKIGTTANQKKLFFNLRKAKSRIAALEEGDMRPEHVALVVQQLGVGEHEVTEMNRRLGGDVSLNAPIRDDGDAGEWQDWLPDDRASQETQLAAEEELGNRRQALSQALGVLNDRERRIFEARRLFDEPITLDQLSAEFGISRERVRQIEERGFQKIRQAVKVRLAAIKTPALLSRASALRRRHSEFTPSLARGDRGYEASTTRLAGNTTRLAGNSESASTITIPPVRVQLAEESADAIEAGLKPGQADFAQLDMVRAADGPTQTKLPDRLWHL